MTWQWRCTAAPTTPAWTWRHRWVLGWPTPPQLPRILRWSSHLCHPTSGTLGNSRPRALICPALGSPWLPCLQATRAALDARALEVLPPALAKKLIKGEGVVWLIVAAELLQVLLLQLLLPWGLLLCGGQGRCRHVCCCCCCASRRRLLRSLHSVSYCCALPPADLRQSAVRKGRLPWYTRSLRVAKTAAFSEATWWAGEPFARQHCARHSAAAGCRLGAAAAGSAWGGMWGCLLLLYQPPQLQPVRPHIVCSRLFRQLRPRAARRPAQGGWQLAEARQVAGHALRPARCARQRGADGSGGRCAHSPVNSRAQQRVLGWCHSRHATRMHAITRACKPLRRSALHPLPLLAAPAPQATAWVRWRPAAAASACGCASRWRASM